MSYTCNLQLISIIAGASPVRRASMPKVLWGYLAGAVRRGYRAAVSLRPFQVHTAKNRWGDDLHGCGQAVASCVASAWYQNLPMPCFNRTQVSHPSHDCRRSSVHHVEQQRNGCVAGSSSSQRVDSACVRTSRDAGRIGMATNNHMRVLLSQEGLA
jgi:hypothetical protein